MEATIMARMDRIGSHATTVVREFAGPGQLTFLSVHFHATEVVRFWAGAVTLKDGGHRSQITKTRMNQAAAEFGLGFRVFQKNWEWFVDFPNEGGQPIPYEDGMTLTFF
jgi:hypothetical protein